MSTPPSAVVKFFADLIPAYRSGEREGLLAAADALGDQLRARRRSVPAESDDPKEFVPPFAASVLHKLLRAAIAAGIAGDEEAAEEGFELAGEAGRHVGAWESATVAGRDLDADLAMLRLMQLDAALEAAAGNVGGEE